MARSRGTQRKNAKEESKDNKSSFVDKYAFFLIFAIGAAGVIFLRAYYDIEYIYIIILPLALMLLYLVVCHFSRRLRLRPDQIGDNIYYLGFLYTLVSLAVALYYFSEEEALEHIISNFGIALGTTILGVALRVVMHQMREDPIDAEQEARSELVEASSKLRSELSSITTQFSSFSHAMRQSVEEAMESVGQSAQSVLRESTEEFRQSTEQLSETSKRVTEDIAATSEEYNKRAKALNSASRRQVTAVEKIADRLESIEIPENYIANKVSDLTEQHQRALEEQLSQFGQTLSSQIEESSRQTFDAMQELTKRQKEVYETFTGQAKEDLENLRENRRAIEAEAERAKRASAEIVNSLAEVERARKAAAEASTRNEPEGALHREAEKRPGPFKRLLGRR
ncbi:hypothetical protein ACFOW6_12110 [Fodinicurvata halophila]|uniref:Uncharacterized protein n=1 Tax=Fodinicurvata halophila TaxID=1419723 RepID=A0ABV8UML8_9PROT